MTSRPRSHQRVAKAAISILLATLALVGLTLGGEAQSVKKATVANLDGSWSGGGSVCSLPVRESRRAAGRIIAAQAIPAT